MVQFGRTYWEKFVLSCTAIFVLLYPTLLHSFFKLIACEGNMYDGAHASSTYNMNDLSLECFVEGGEHMTYFLLVGLPNFFLFVIGLPVCMLMLLMYAKHNLHIKTSNESHDSIRYRYGLLMAGFRDEAYMWDIVVNARKACMALIVTFGSIAGPDGQLYFAILMFGLFICLQVGFHPYRTNLLNRMELMSLAIVFFSLYFGTTYFYQKWGGNESILLWTSIALISVQVS